MGLSSTLATGYGEFLSLGRIYTHAVLLSSCYLDSTPSSPHTNRPRIVVFHSVIFLLTFSLQLYKYISMLQIIYGKSLADGLKIRAQLPETLASFLGALKIMSNIHWHLCS